MSRKWIAILAALVGLTLYLWAVLWLGDRVQTLHWALQVPFFVVAGIAWAFPIRRLMFWAAGK
ncbi:DUF2842 domain-containing protein [Roseomonas sp. 18066]|uniref:DUF2842 domain-containing protein n=1 Tax=Roseomonas sp. 18066 TaxID=2681412 RepID=UPI0013577C94|nr:DUF2842 domain-containing protein [Roseomonas sp. 18066]